MSSSRSPILFPSFLLPVLVAMGADVVASPVDPVGDATEATEATEAAQAGDGADPGAASSRFRERVTVTASRAETPVRESGSSVTVIDRESLEASPYAVLADVLRGVPGLSVSRAGGDGALTQIRMRGAEANHVLVLIDGIPANDLFAADELPFELMTVQEIERVEIVRGPQSGIWGGDAVAGVIHVLTRRGEPRTEFRLEAGSSDTVNASGRLSFGTGPSRWTATGAYFDSEGTNVSRTGSEKDGTSNGTFSVRYDRYEDGRPLDLEVAVRRTESTSEFDGIDFVTTGLPADSDDETETRWTSAHAVARWHRDGSAWTHRAHVSFGDTDTDTFSSGAPAGSTAVQRRDVSLQTTFAFGDARLERRLVAVVDREDRDFEQRGTASPFGDPNQDRSWSTTGAAVEFATGRPGRWSANAAIRHDAHDAFDDATTFRVAGTSALGASPSRLRAAFGTGQKPPTFLERYGFFSDTFVGNPDLKPETSVGWEIGLDTDWNDRWSTALTWFESTLEDEINGFAFDPSLGAFTARNETEESDRRGVEFAVDGRIGRTTVRASHTWIDATQPDPVAGTSEELRRPRHVSALHVGHAFRARPVSLQFDVVRNGSQTDLVFPPFPQPSAVVRLDGYWLASVAARYRLNDVVELHARVENALDEAYEDVYGFATPGRRAWAGLRVRTTR